MRRSAFVLVGAAVTAVLLGMSWGWTPASAEAGPQSEMAIVVMDSSAASQMEDAIPLTLSFIGLAATLQRGNDIVFVDTERPGEPVGPFRVLDVDFSSRQREIAARMREDGAIMPQSIPEALDEARSILDRYGAPAGSTIYLASGGRSATDRGYDALSYTVAPLLDRIAERGWTIHGLQLRTDDQGVEQFLSGVSRPTGGMVFSLASGSDLKPLADYLSSRAGAEDLTEIGARTLAESETFSASLNISPGTEESTLFFFNGGRSGSFRLTNPDGVDVSSGGPAASIVIETENLVIWRLMNPQPGQWRVDASGIDGGVSVWGQSSSRYELVLRTLSPMPVGEPSSVMAYATDGGRTVALEGTRMFAEITGPDSSVSGYELLDDGTHGDLEAGDGYYTFTLPAIESAGSYDVKLDLSWTDSGHKITSDSAFDALVFPSFHFDAVSVSGLEVGEATRVGMVSVHVNGGPYAVDPGEITAVIVSPTGERGKLDLVPRRLYGNGPAWQYDALFTPEEGGVHTIQFVLQVEYGGRTYTDTSSLMLIANEAPLVPAAPVAVEPAEAPSIPEPVNAPAVPAVSGIPVSADPQPQFPWVAASIGALAVVIAGVVVAFFMTRPSPFGYLYTDEDDEVVDFSNLQRRPLLQFFYKSLIRGSELNVPGLEGLVFQFMRDRVNVKSFDESPSVRVNNQPLLDSATINDKAWIGAEGRLYTFLSVPKPATGLAEGD